MLGLHVRDLGLPRDALVSIIVRDDEAIAPRGSTRIRAGDRLHILVRREVAEDVDALQERRRHGPIGAPPRPRRRLRGASPILTVRPSGDDAVVADVAAPERVLGQSVAARLRLRRRSPRSARRPRGRPLRVTGPLLIAGSRDAVTAYARRRVRSAEPDYRAWLQTVVDALAIDILDAAPARQRDGASPSAPAARR